MYSKSVSINLSVRAVFPVIYLILFRKLNIIYYKSCFVNPIIKNLLW